MEGRYIAVIDLGTSKLFLVVAKVEGDKMQVVYGRETPSEGIRYGRVVNPAQAGKAIGNAISLAKEELGIGLTQIVVGYPRCDVVLKNDHIAVPRNADECVTADDISNLKSLMADSYVAGAENDDETLFGVAAQSFNCGDETFQISERDVIGMTTKELSGNFKLFIGQAKYVNDMELAFKKAGDISVLRKYFVPEATARAVLYDSEMENGVALIDLGAGVTSVSIFIGGILRHYAAVPFGGRSVTTDIKTLCAIPESLSENIKKAYGACMPDRLMNLGDKTLVLTTDKALSPTQLPVQYLSEIITARETEIINAILYEIQESGFADRLRGVVLTGGGAEMINISTLFKELSGYSVRIGEPHGDFFTASVELGPAASATVGMLLLAKEEGCINCCSDAVSGGGSSADNVDVEGDTVFDTGPETGNDNDRKKKKEKKERRQKGAEQEDNTVKKEDGQRKPGGRTLFDFFDNLSREDA